MLFDILSIFSRAWLVRQILKILSCYRRACSSAFRSESSILPDEAVDIYIGTGGLILHFCIFWMPFCYLLPATFSIYILYTGKGSISIPYIYI